MNILRRTSINRRFVLMFVLQSSLCVGLLGIAFQSFSTLGNALAATTCTPPALPSTLAEARGQFLVVFSVLVFGSLGAYWFMARSLSQPILNAVEIADRVASGDLTKVHAVDGNDEAARLLEALQSMRVQLKKLVRDVRQTSDQVSVATSEIAHGNDDLSQRTTVQLGILRSAVTAVHVLSKQASATADDADRADQLARAASEAAGRSAAVARSASQTMNGMAATFQRTEQFVAVIQSISFQTNVLALNAAAEAARAGAHGRGFSVVASEVRTLSQRAAEAAKEIAGIVEKSAQEIQQGSAQVGKAGDAMSDANAAAKQVCSVASSLRVTVAQQRTALVALRDTIEVIDKSTQQNATLVEQVAAAASALRGRTTELVNMVRAFRIGDL